MSPIVMLGLALIIGGAGYVYLRNKNKKPDDTYYQDNGEDISDPTFITDDDNIPIIQTQTIFYPYDDIPDILQKPQPRVLYHPYYGCPPRVQTESTE